MEARGRYPAQRAADALHTMVLARRDDLQGDRPLRGAGSVRDGLYAHYGARADDSALRCDHPLAHPADEPYPHAGIRCRVEGGGARHAVAELAALRHVRIHHLRPPAQILRDRRTAGLLFRDGGEYRIRARQVRNRSHSFRQLRQCEGRVGPPDQILRDARRQGVDRPADRRDRRRETGASGRHPRHQDRRPAGTRGDKDFAGRDHGQFPRQNRAGDGCCRFDRIGAVPPIGDVRHPAADPVRQRRDADARDTPRNGGSFSRSEIRPRDRRRADSETAGLRLPYLSAPGGIPCRGLQARAAHGGESLRSGAGQRRRIAQRGGPLYSLRRGEDGDDFDG